MLKRNGENCEHQVPNYPGLLTASEHTAYQAAVPLVAEQVRLYNERTKVLTDIENHCSEIAKKVAEQKSGPSTDTWQVQHSLFKTSRGEMTLCSRGAGEKLEFGVIEHFDPNSAYAHAQGNSDEILRGNNAFLVLQNFVENERAVLQLYRRDIKATVEEKLAEIYPKVDAARVARAVAARCDGQIQVQVEKEASAQSIKISM